MNFERFLLEDKETFLSFCISSGFVFDMRSFFLTPKKNSLCEWYILPNKSKHGKETGKDLFGRKKWEIEFFEGKRHGKHVCWARNKIYYEAEYFCGKMEGKQIWYHGNGKKKLEVTWIDGKTEGKMIKWYWGGNLLSVSEFKNGKKHGKEIFYLRSGKTSKEVLWGNGKRL